MSAHTPGPWHSNAPLARFVDQPALIFAGDPRDLTMPVNVLAADCPQVDANATLIAAAPELLDVLRAVAESCEQVGELPTCGERQFLCGIAKAARAAIAKATGEAQS